jgi:putative two-component system response regulator
MERESKMIFIVDDDMTILTAGKAMLKGRYKVCPVPSISIMFDLLENITPDLILLDIEMPEINGYEAIKRLKLEPKWAEIPVIFLTSRVDKGSELKGLSLGAIDYVTKPFSASLLRKRIENHLKLAEFNTNLKEMVQRKSAQIFNLQNAVLSTVADMVEFRDEVTGGHVARSQQYLKLLVDKLLEEGIYTDEVSHWDMDYLLPSAQLHDVGKIAISDTILNKPDKLISEEFESAKTHVVIEVKIIKHQLPCR